MKWLINTLIALIMIASVNAQDLVNENALKRMAISPPISAAWMYMSDNQNYKDIPSFWASINFKKVDLLLIGPAGVQADGTFGLYESEKTGNLANRFKWILKTARTQNPDIKIIISQWWGEGTNIWGRSLSAVNSEDEIKKYTDSVASFIQSYLSVYGGVDGYDIDYEDNNVTNKISEITSQIRTKIDALGKANNDRLFYLTLSPATTAYVQGTLGSVNFVNMQTYAGGAGAKPQDYLNLGLKSKQLLYGICPELNCGSPTVEQAESQYKQFKLAGIHLWRLNSGNYNDEGKVQEQIYNFLHGTK